MKARQLQHGCVWLMLSALASAGCTSVTSPSTEPSPVSSTSSTTVGESEHPTDGHGVVDMYLPPSAPGDGAVPLIVLVPGGGWVTADPTGMIPLAEALATSGAVVATTTYRTSEDGVFFPTPVEDVACAFAEAAADASDAGFDLTDVVVVGHSAGAQLVALAALRPDDFSADCPYPVVHPSRLVGLAGPYDVVLAADAARALFGPDRPDPAAWDDGNPMSAAGNRPEMSVLLVHGTSDRTVPMIFTNRFADALGAGGHDVTVVRRDEVDHQSVYGADIAGPEITAWLEG